MNVVPLLDQLKVNVLPDRTTWSHTGVGALIGVAMVILAVEPRMVALNRSVALPLASSSKRMK